MRIFLVVGFLFNSLLSSGQVTRPDLNIFSEKARNFAKSGFTDSAAHYFDKAITVAKGTQDSLAIAELLIEKGKVYETAGFYEPSINAYIESLNISKRLHDRVNQALCYMGLSNVDFRVANNEGAWQHGLNAVASFETLHDTAHYISASMLVGQIEISLGKLDEANAIYMQMLTVAKQIGDSSLIADNLDHLGAIQSFRKEYSKALPYHEQALTINKQINNQFNLAINYANIGEVYMRMGKYAKARGFLTAALVLEKKINANSVMIFTYYTLGECYSLMGQPNIALDNFNKSLELINQQGETRERPYVYNLLSDHYERNHDIVRSLQYFRKSSIERDSLRLASSTYAMEELKIVYEADKREHELRSALLENKLQNTKLQNSNQTIELLVLAIGTAIIGLLITAVLTMRLYKSEKQLKLANKTKSALLSIIGHDLRGPMANIGQLTQLMKQTEGQEREQIINMLHKPVHAASNLLDDLLAWSRSTRQQAISIKSHVQVADATNRAIELFRDQASAKQIQLKVNLPAELTVFADVNHVSSIMRNLISNAIKFTPAGGVVTIDHQAENGYACVGVQDTGLGIEPNNIKAILEARFFSTYGTQSEKGSGFGLMLCQEFLKLNNGRLNIESKVGKGSRISFTLPCP